MREPAAAAAPAPRPNDRSGPRGAGAGAQLLGNSASHPDNQGGGRGIGAFAPSGNYDVVPVREPSTVRGMPGEIIGYEIRPHEDSLFERAIDAVADAYTWVDEIGARAADEVLEAVDDIVRSGGDLYDDVRNLPGIGKAIGKIFSVFDYFFSVEDAHAPTIPVSPPPPGPH